MTAGFDVERVRADFPILQQRIHGRPLAFLDSAASAQKPRAVIEAMSRFYECDYANIHRGVYQLAERATRAFEGARETTRRFLNADETREIVFVRGTTEAINLVAQAWGREHVAPGDEILITHMEHHSNIVPWQLLCQHQKAVLRVAPVDDRGALLMGEFEKLLTWPTSAVSRCWWTAPRPCPTAASTYGPWTATSTPSRATKCSGRRGSASSTASPTCWIACPRTREAVR
jgi:cysteine desulfurase/selenocysteine lyase